MYFEIIYNFVPILALVEIGRTSRVLLCFDVLTLWTPEDGIPTLHKLPYAAGLRYTVQTARYHTRRQTVYLRNCA